MPIISVINFDMVIIVCMMVNMILIIVMEIIMKRIWIVAMIKVIRTDADDYENNDINDR